MEVDRMPENKNNQGPQRPQPQQQRPVHDHGQYHERSRSDGRTTTTSQKPAPGHKK